MHVLMATEFLNAWSGSAQDCACPPEFGRSNGVNALPSVRIDHIKINVIDLTAAKQFYDGVLGRVEFPRPESFDFGSIALGLKRVAPQERQRQ
jgi:hypothetical protein